jgi:membrane protein
MRKNFIKELKLIWREYEEHYVLVRVISILYQKIFQFDIDVRAAAVAYNFTLAVYSVCCPICPLIILIIR